MQIRKPGDYMTYHLTRMDLKKFKAKKEEKNAWNGGAREKNWREQHGGLEEKSVKKEETERSARTRREEIQISPEDKTRHQEGSQKGE